MVPSLSLLFQDMCVVCGSFGKGVEGQLLACAQCAQCYHPYCVNSKVSDSLTEASVFSIWLDLTPSTVCPAADHQDDAPEGLALLGVHRVRGVWEGLGPVPAAAV